MKFAEALTRIEELLKEIVLAKSYSAHSELISEMLTLMEIYADSIVQLGKVAQEMRRELSIAFTLLPESEEGDILKVIWKLDKLMNGEEG